MSTAYQYPLEVSNLNLKEEQYQKNQKNWTPVLDRFLGALQDVSSEGTEASLSRHQGRGQLLRKSIDNHCRIEMLYIQPMEEDY